MQAGATVKSALHGTQQLPRTDHIKPSVKNSRREDEAHFQPQEAIKVSPTTSQCIAGLYKVGSISPLGLAEEETPSLFFSALTKTWNWSLSQCSCPASSTSPFCACRSPLSSR